MTRAPDKTGTRHPLLIIQDASPVERETYGKLPMSAITYKFTNMKIHNDFLPTFPFADINDFTNNKKRISTMTFVASVMYD